MEPYPPYELVIKDITPSNIVLTFQAEVHYYLWKFVKLVQMCLLVSNRPDYVKNLSCGGENG